MFNIPAWVRCAHVQDNSPWLPLLNHRWDFLGCSPPAKSSRQALAYMRNGTWATRTMRETYISGTTSCAIPHPSSWVANLIWDMTAKSQTNVRTQYVQEVAIRSRPMQLNQPYSSHGICLAVNKSCRETTQCKPSACHDKQKSLQSYPTGLTWTR